MLRIIYPICDRCPTSRFLHILSTTIVLYGANAGTGGRHPAGAELKEKICMPKISLGKTHGYDGFRARFARTVHFENVHAVSAHSDFSRAEVQTMLILNPQRP